jgi:hypothetical protein
MNRHRPPPRTGSQAFGDEADQRPTGAQAFGGPDDDDPLRGALLFGNDPRGNPRGSESFGGSDEKTPLRGAILFGNDPRGNPRGSESFGGADEAMPLRGALLVGNDPRGNPRGSEAFGSPDDKIVARGSQAFGAGEGISERLKKDLVGYDFGGVLLVTDDSSLAGVRKDGRNRLRERIVRLLGRRLAVVPEKLRHGLGESSIPWGKLKRQRELDTKLAQALRGEWRRAPGEVLGIQQVADLLEREERFHTCELHCEWDLSPVQMTVFHNAKPAAYARSALHKEHQYFIFTDVDGKAQAYVDALVPRRGEQRARIRDTRGARIASLVLETPRSDQELDPGRDDYLFRAELRDRQDAPICRVQERRASPTSFLAQLLMLDSDEEVGEVRDVLTGGKIRTAVEMDLAWPRAVAWGLGAVLADLARLRRRGWPKVTLPGAPEVVESVQDALGPRKR